MSSQNENIGRTEFSDGEEEKNKIFLYRYLRTDIKRAILSGVPPDQVREGEKKKDNKMESANNTAVVQQDGLAELEETLARVRAAQQIFASYSQEKVDAIFKAASLAANRARIPLAKMAVEETGMGVVEIGRASCRDRVSGRV